VILLDTSALYALTDTADEKHALARKGLAMAEDGGLPFVVHTYVLAETFALVHRRLSLRAAIRMSDELAGVDVVVVDRLLHDRGVSWLRASPKSRVRSREAVAFARFPVGRAPRKPARRAAPSGPRLAAVKESSIPSHPLTLVDAVSFVIMAERGIEQAFAFDADFERAGFTLFPEG